MAFDVYPTPQTARLNVPSGGAGVATAFIERLSSGGGLPEMFIRVALASGAAAPTLQLQAGTGDPVTPPSVGTQSIFSLPGSNGYVAAATMSGPIAGVYLITVYVSVSGSAWKLIIANNDAANQLFTFVVADSDAGSQQPWIDAAATLAFSALVTESFDQSLTLSNYGTGPLSSISGTVAGSGFSVTVPAGTQIAPSGSASIPVTLTAAATPQTASAVLTIGSNDTTAQLTVGHNSKVTLSASIGELELGFMLDASGSMAFNPDGTTTFLGASSNRWGMLVSAASATFDLLKNFAIGKGNFAVGMYPDITAFPASASTAYSGPFPVNSPSAANFTAMSPITAANLDGAKTSVAAHTPRVNGAATPMGAGIAQAIGATSNSFGYFASSNFTLNRRWLILMTDGNDNSDPPYPTDFYGNGTSGQGFAPKQIQVMGLGYGNSQASGAIAPVNTTLLTSIVENGYQGAAGNYHDAQADATPDLVASFVKTLLSAGLTLDSASDPAGVLSSATPSVSRQVLIGPYDRKIAFFVAWGTAGSELLDVTVTTPLGELLPGAVDAGISIDGGDRYRMLTFDKGFLDNVPGGQPRYGTWTLTLTLNRGSVIAGAAVGYGYSEPYSYQVITDSRLNLRCELDKTSYAAGDPITLSARLSLDGQPVNGAAVSVTQTNPAAGALNWLAATPLSAADYAATVAAQSANPDIDSLGIKRLALATNGVLFSAATNTAAFAMTDTGGIGSYTLTSNGNTVPGTYQFLITAVGLLADGSLFRRERSVTLEVVVRADPAATILQLAYLTGAGRLSQVVATVWPKDRFGNTVLIDPHFDPSLLFTTTEGNFAAPIIDNHDGSYSRTLDYPPGAAPVIGVTVGGITVTPVVPVVSPGALHYADRVYSFAPGAQAAPGANQHADPLACLGDFTKKPSPGFVSLGAGGHVVVGFSGHVVVDDADGDGITVFVQPDQPLRRYSVEAHLGDDQDDWFEIGTSPGVTQTFSLRGHHHRPTARAFRIIDRSGALLNTDGSASATPGISIVAIGAARLAPGDEGLDDLICAWLRKLGHLLFG